MGRRRVINDFTSLYLEGWTEDALKEVNGRPGRNSPAMKGNILEAINLALTGFERNNEDRNFDRYVQIPFGRSDSRVATHMGVKILTPLF